jgi:uncharacterized protein YPO0396
MYQWKNDIQPASVDGFRLCRLEVYNWGTFNRHIWTIEPDGGTALLTGANGSGKSTLVDALLTLLVPHARRSYNQASGAERRRERDERSYVRGAYGRAKDSESNTGMIRFLRGKDAYSVLLAVFAARGQEVTLAQVFWTQDDSLRKFYLVAPRALNIRDHFTSSGDMAELRRRLKSSGADVYDEFVRYSAHFCKLFGLRSEKALDLFNQIVSIKEIGGLNEFVRAHMLEKTQAQEKITQLRENYENLTKAHDAIQKAERQLAQLQPLLAEAARYQEVEARIVETERCSAALPVYFAQQTIDLIERATAEIGSRLSEARGRLTELEARLIALRGQQLDLHAAIANDSIGQRLQALAREVERVDERLAERRAKAEKYDTLTRTLDLPSYGEEATFIATLQRAREELPEIEAHVGRLVTARDAHVQAANRLEESCQALREELESLRHRRSQIPAEDLRLRTQLAAALDIDEDELPFTGELLKVREDTQRWEGAIERLLHGYGRQVLVPETHYRQVSAYVDATNLRGRLVYCRVDDRRHPMPAERPDDAILLDKLEIKPDTPYYDWLRADLATHYDFVCCETMEQFQRERRALTINGQIKRGGTLHEKDDRHPLGDRKRYVLGWDNHAKIAALAAELETRSQELAAVRATVAANQEEQHQCRARQHLVHELLAFDRFTTIDWRADERMLRELETQRRELESDADHLRLLRGQLAAVEDRIRVAEAEKTEALAAVTTHEGDLRRLERQRRDCEARLGAHDAAALEPYLARIEADLRDKTLTLETVQALQEQSRDSYARSVAALKGQLNTLGPSITTRMVTYTRDFPEDCADVDTSISAIGEYRRMLERIEREDLPRYARRFKELLDEKVIASIVIFKSGLEKQMEEIKASIDHLNASLQAIDYSPSTYIQLCHEASRDREIAEFRHALRDCLPDVGRARTASDNEASFQKIRALIERFEQEERWTAKVTDVRNWLEFSAEERYREDDQIKNYYSDSAGKSGGQKAKLAYTILASAIAYQYGLGQDVSPSKTFRFVVVDEAFSKSDETNSRFAMELFKRFNLQLLVVTPLDKTHVVEPYIMACHFVANNEEENDSRVYNLTIQQYYEQKALVRAGALAR